MSLDQFSSDRNEYGGREGNRGGVRGHIGVRTEASTRSRVNVFSGLAKSSKYLVSGSEAQCLHHGRK